MNYTEFINLHPRADLALEFFKGVAPTIVALLAIIINNVLIEFRNKENRKAAKKREINASKITVLNTMLEKYSKLSQLFWISGTRLIQYLSEETAEKRTSLMSEFEKSLYEFQFKSQEIYDYFKSMFEQYDFHIGCDTIVEDTREFAFALIDICEQYKDACKIENSLQRNKALDTAADEIAEKTIETKAWTHVIMLHIGQEIKKLYEECGN